MSVDLSQLWRLREECLQIKAYNEALNKAIEVQRQEKERADRQNARHRRRDALDETMCRQREALAQRLKRRALLTWHLPSRRCHFQRLALEREGTAFWRGRWLRAWRLACIDSQLLSQEEVRREREMLASGVDAKLEKAKADLRAARRRHLSLHLTALDRAKESAEWQICQRVFLSWSWQVSLEAIHRRQVMLLESRCRSSRFLQDMLLMWRSLCEPHRLPRVPCLEARSVLVLEQMAVDRLRVIIDAWSHEAGFLEKRQAAANFQQIFPLRAAAFLAQRLEAAAASASLWQWRRFTRAHAWEAWSKATQSRQEREAEMSSRRHLADLRWRSEFEAVAGSLLLRWALSHWVASWLSPQRSARQKAQQENLRLQSFLAESEGRAMMRAREPAVAAGALRIGSLVHGRLRLALGLLAPAAEESVFQQLQVCQASASRSAAERQSMEDWFVEQQHGVGRARRTAQEVAGAWVAYLQLRLFRRSLLAWRVGMLKLQVERKRQWQEMQRRSQADAYRERCRDKQAKAAEALFSSTGHQSVRLALRQWHGVAFKERRSKEIARLREQSQARIAQQQRRIEQANLATIRYREHAFAPFFAASEEGSAKWLQIFLWDWKRAVTSSASKRILRLWRIIASMELFKCKVWLAESCIRLWACVVRVARLEASAEDHLLPIMAIQAEARLQASVEARIAAGESLLLLHTLLCAWRRFRQVEMLKLEVQRACQRWNGEERKVMQTLRDVEHSVGKVWGFAVHAMDKHHAREDLRDVLLAWAQEACYGKVETQLLAACEEAHKGPQEQRRFEAMVRERWTDRSLRFHQRDRARSCVASYLSSWRQAALQETAQRRRRERKERAASVIERWLDQERLREVQSIFDAWQLAVCSARQQWLEQRRRWLETVLEHSDAAWAQPAVPSLQEKAFQPQQELDFAAKLQQFTFGLS
ncbi:unnamed protein product [Effrenium voratum]|uniref:Uncharacterized protein n=1 Tax=Effrenium voratum TaxID=2562239 RepID=A0AA36IU32_9DINO|nr:unnamed protein product [Effrenium voratum]